jgi:hypothetical protein
MSGKGDKPRPYSTIKYGEGYDFIKWKNKPIAPPKSGLKSKKSNRPA